MVLGKFNTDLVIFADLSVPLPEGEDEAPAPDSKDTADEKLDGKWSRNLQCFLWNKSFAFVFPFVFSFPCHGSKA